MGMRKSECGSGKYGKWEVGRRKRQKVRRWEVEMVGSEKKVEG
jgi:hypothetical protein